MNDSITIARLGAADVVALQPDFERVYAAAFGEPPYRRNALDAQRFAQALGAHTRERGFDCLAARADDGRVLGFAYGYTGEQGQWWNDIVSSVMTRENVTRWLTDRFELVELAVLPEAQGRGIGARLHDDLVAVLPHATAVLSTIAEETVALGLYLRRGWQVVVPAMRFPNTPEPFQVLGLDLATVRQQAQR